MPHSYWRSNRGKAGIEMDHAATLSRRTVDVAIRRGRDTTPLNVSRFASEWAASLIGWVQLLPGLMAGWAVVMYIQPDPAIRSSALAGGFGAGVVSWLLLGLAAIKLAGPERSNRTVY